MTPDQIRRAVAGDKEMIARLSAELKRGDPIAGLDTLSAQDGARLILALSPKKARALLRRLPDAPSLALLEELDPRVAARLLDPETQHSIARLVAKLEVEEAAQFLAESPPALTQAVLAQTPHPEALRAAIAFRAGTAGAVMRHRLVAAPKDWTVADVIEAVRSAAERVDKLYAVYVIDDERRLVGHLKIRDLLLNPADARVGDIARPDPVSIGADADREDALRLAAKERLKALPVVNREGRLVGMVSAEELAEIARAEADEDMSLMAGLDPEASAADGPVTIVRRRLPWLAGGLAGSGVAALVVGAYEDALTEAAILASLIPIVMSLAGNAGIQASTVTVQAISGGALWVGDLWGRLWREVGGALLNGGLVGLLVAAGIMGISTVVEIDRPASLAVAAALTLLAVTLQAACVGSMVPLALRRLGLDPAVATGVFITTSNDMVGVLVFFMIATAIYL